MHEDPTMQAVVYESPPRSPLRKALASISHINPWTKLVLVAAIVTLVVGGGSILITHTGKSITPVTAKPKTTIAITHTSLAPTSQPTSSPTKAAQTTPKPAPAPTTQSKTPGTSSSGTTQPVITGTSPTTSSGGSVPAGSSLSCPNPIYSVSWPQTQYGGWQDANGTHVNANVLTGAGGSNSQVLNICSATNWNVVANFTDSGGSINTYPDTEYDMAGDKTIAQYNSMQTCFGSQEPTPSGPQWPTPGGSEWDYAYDVWINHHTGENVWSNDIEIMVWNDWTDNMYPPAVGSVAAGGSRAVTIDGVAYHMFQGGGANEWIYTRDVKATSGCFDMLNIMKDLAASESVTAGITTASVPEHIEYGVEIAGTYGTQTFQITNAALTVQ